MTHTPAEAGRGLLTGEKWGLAAIEILPFGVRPRHLDRALKTWPEPEEPALARCRSSDMAAACPSVRECRLSGFLVAALHGRDALEVV